MFAVKKSSSIHPVTKAARREHKPAFETLEERQHFSVVTVTNTNDSGAGSLRQAILTVDADTSSTTDTIDFHIGSGAKSIDLSYDLASITHSVVIDGTSQPGFAGTPIITVKIPVASQGLNVVASKVTIKGMAIDGTGSGAFYLTGSHETIENNIISGAGNTGIYVLDSSNDQITGNTISNPKYWGIYLTKTSTGETLSNNKVTLTAGSNDVGIELDANAGNNTISGNTISGGHDGIVVGGNSNTLTGNTITDSYAAIDLEGSLNTVWKNTLSKGVLGIWLDNNSFSQDGSISSGGDSNTISQNTISQNQSVGIDIYDVKDNTIIKNTIDNNGGAGVYAYGGNKDRFSQNLIYANQSGIFVDDANDSLAAPVLSKSTYNGPWTDVTGTATAAANSTITLEFFANPAGGDQGQIYLGSEQLTTNAQGVASFTSSLQATTGAGDTVTVTATNAAGDTSEFSNAVTDQQWHNPIIINPIILHWI